VVRGRISCHPAATQLPPSCHPAATQLPPCEHTQDAKEHQWAGSASLDGLEGLRLPAALAAALGSREGRCPRRESRLGSLGSARRPSNDEAVGPLADVRNPRPVLGSKHNTCALPITCPRAHTPLACTCPLPIQP
jgi:hypothetical protein